MALSGAVQPGVHEFHKDGFDLSTDPARLDLAVIHGFLARSWWAKGIPRDTVARSLRRSLCFGLYEGQRQIGFARVITDAATFAYMCDDFILPEYRGRGLGKWLMQCILAHPELQDVHRWTLIAEDPRLYARFGFKPLEQPGIHMESVTPYPESQTPSPR